MPRLWRPKDAEALGFMLMHGSTSTIEKQDETGPRALRSVAVGPYPRSLQGFAPLAEVPE